MIAPEVWAEICPVFAQRSPLEAVVAVYGDGSWEELSNAHRTPETAFELSPEDSARLLARPPHVFLHSHTTPQFTKDGDPLPLDMPSDLDCLQQIATGWTWGIVAVSRDNFGNVLGVEKPRLWGDAVPRAPLLGRRWEWVYSDCFTLFRDGMAERGIYLPDVPRVHDSTVYPAGHWAHRYYEHWIKQLGFVPIERHERRAGDACVRRSGESSHLDHVSLYMGEGKYLDISRKRPSHEYIADDEERFMRVTGARFYRWKGRK